MSRQARLPWIPNEADWRLILDTARQEPIRNRTMLALGYDAGLRREELCSLRTDDIDPGHWLLRIRAETTKSRRERVVPYSAVSGELLRAYLVHRAGISRARGPLFLSESRRNHAEPLTPWTWSKVIRRIALVSGVPRFGTHTLRHLCLTDLARAGWELHAIATFAGHWPTSLRAAWRKSTTGASPCWPRSSRQATHEPPGAAARHLRLRPHLGPVPRRAGGAHVAWMASPPAPELRPGAAAMAGYPAPA